MAKKSWTCSSVVLSALLACTPMAAGAAQSCSVNVSPLSFGVHSPASAIDLMTTGSIQLLCSEATPISILIDRGAGASMGNRRMAGGGHFLSYNIYMDARGSQIWGDGTGGSKAYNTLPAAGSILVIPFYGRVLAGQTGAWVASYSDSITVTVRF